LAVIFLAKQAQLTSQSLYFWVDLAFLVSTSLEIYPLLASSIRRKRSAEKKRRNEGRKRGAMSAVTLPHPKAKLLAVASSGMFTLCSCLYLDVSSLVAPFR